jgi:peptide/nickel transport system substrate-binding protein
MTARRVNPAAGRPPHGWRLVGSSVALVIVATACGSQVPSGSPPASGGPGTPSVTPAAGGTIVWAKANEVSLTDMQVDIGLANSDVGFRVYETLVAVNDDGTIGPWLATSWDQPSDTTLVFHLREGVRFSNGREMTADDVVISLTRAADPNIDVNGRFSSIDRVAKVDPYTVRIDLKEPTGALPAVLAGQNAVIYPGEELEAGTFDPAKELLGTGPFMVEEHKQDESWTLVRNPHYWREGRPLADELVIRILNDDSARVAALKGGTADVATFDAPDTASLFAGDPNIVVQPQTTAEYYTMFLNALTPVQPQLKDARVRQAIGLALDRQQIISLALAGSGEPLVGNGTLASLPDACDPSQLPAPNPDEARRLLDEAGALPMSFTIDVYTGYPVLAGIAQVVQQQLQAVGITVEINQGDVGEIGERVFTTGEFDALMIFDTTFVDNWITLGNDSAATAPWRAVFTPSTPDLDALLTQTRRMVPGPQRAPIFQEICSKIAENAFSIPLATRTYFVVYRRDRLIPVIQTFEPNLNNLKNVADWGRVP